MNQFETIFLESRTVSYICCVNPDQGFLGLVLAFFIRTPDLETQLNRDVNPKCWLFSVCIFRYRMNNIVCSFGIFRKNDLSWTHFRRAFERYCSVLPETYVFFLFSGVILDITFDRFLGLKKPYVHRLPTFLGCSAFQLFSLVTKILKRLWSDYIAEANPCPSLTGMNPLLADTGTLGCWVSPLARCVPP